jgi:DNA-binding Lrp family transcriptional regulator
MTTERTQADLWQLFWGALVTRLLAIAADLGVADALADGPRPVDELAREVGADPDALHRILRALASDGVFAEEAPGVYRNTEASGALRRGTRWHDFAHLFGGVWHRALGELNAAGEPTFERIHGTDFWSWLGERPDERGAFDRAMSGSWEWKVDRVASADWRGDELVVDVGGGNGALLIELLRRRPGLRGIVFDLPETTRDEPALGDRIEFVAGSFFERVPPGDVYVLSTILHDWDDAHAGQILRTIRAAAPDDGRLLVVDAVVPTGNEPHGAKFLDLLMLGLFGARERDEAQWRALLEQNGFEPIGVEDGLVEARCR